MCSVAYDYGSTFNVISVGAWAPYLPPSAAPLCVWHSNCCINMLSDLIIVWFIQIGAVIISIPSHVWSRSYRLLSCLLWCCLFVWINEWMTQQESQHLWWQLNWASLHAARETVSRSSKSLARQRSRSHSTVHQALLNCTTNVKPNVWTFKSFLGFQNVKPRFF